MKSINLKLVLATLFSLIAIFIMPKNLRSADKEYGEYLSSECRTCHIPSGKFNTGIPLLDGKSFGFLVIALKEYKNKERTSPIMQMIAGRLDGEQIDALAAYFSSLK